MCTLFVWAFHCASLVRPFLSDTMAARGWSRFVLCEVHTSQYMLESKIETRYAAGRCLSATIELIQANKGQPTRIDLPTKSGNPMLFRSLTYLKSDMPSRLVVLAKQRAFRLVQVAEQAGLFPDVSCKIVFLTLWHLPWSRTRENDKDAIGFGQRPRRCMLCTAGRTNPNIGTR